MIEFENLRQSSSSICWVMEVFAAFVCAEASVQEGPGVCDADTLSLLENPLCFYFLWSEVNSGTLLQLPTLFRSVQGMQSFD